MNSNGNREQPSVYRIISESYRIVSHINRNKTIIKNRQTLKTVETRRDKLNE